MCSMQWSKEGQLHYLDQYGNIKITKVHLDSLICGVEPVAWWTVILRVQRHANLVQAMQRVEDVEHDGMIT